MRFNFVVLWYPRGSEGVGFKKCAVVEGVVGVSRRGYGNYNTYTTTYRRNTVSVMGNGTELVHRSCYSKLNSYLPTYPAKTVAFRRERTPRCGRRTIGGTGVRGTTTVFRNKYPNSHSETVRHGGRIPGDAGAFSRDHLER